MTDDFDSAMDLVWHFADSSEVVLMDGIFQVIDDMKQQKPEKAILRYHQFIENPQGPYGPADFDVKVVWEVAWRAERASVEGDAKKQNSLTLAALIPADKWDMTKLWVVFSSRWAAQGLTGIKPSLWLRNSIVLPPGQGLQLTTAQG